MRFATGTTATLGGERRKCTIPSTSSFCSATASFTRGGSRRVRRRFSLRRLLSRGVGALTLDNMLGSDELLSTFDVDNIATEALLFQTGYLTIQRTEPRGNRIYYRLSYPNQEVRQSLNESLLNHLTGSPAQQAEHSARLYDLLLVNDFASLENLFKAFFASIPLSVAHE